MQPNKPYNNSNNKKCKSFTNINKKYRPKINNTSKQKDQMLKLATAAAIPTTTTATNETCKNVVHKSFVNFKFNDKVQLKNYKTQNDSNKRKNAVKSFRSCRPAECNIDDDDESSSSTTRSLSSTLSSCVEADEEDENESEEAAQRVHNKPRANDNLLQVQNFLNAFDGEERHINCNAMPRHSKVPTTNIPTTATNNTNDWQQIHYNYATNGIANFYASSATGNHNVAEIISATSSLNTKTSSELRNYRNHQTKSIAPAAILANNLTSLAMTTTLAATSTNTQTNFAGKSAKFTISTKFLRKPRNKLRTAHLMTTITPLDTQQEQQQQQQQQQQLLQQQNHFMLYDDTNAKFKDFSIDSLLNK